MTPPTAVVADEHAGRRAQVARRVAPGANSQGVINDLELDCTRGLIDERQWKSREAVIHIECHARLGRREGMRDECVRIHGAKIIEQRLIGHLTR